VSRRIDITAKDWEGLDYLTFARRWKAPEWVMTILTNPDLSMEEVRTPAVGVVVPVNTIKWL